MSLRLKVIFLGVVALLTSIGTVEVSLAQNGAPRCGGLRATIVGTPGDDSITGTDGDDVIVALGGNDTVDAGAGDDRVCGGDGHDTVYSGNGNDWIAGDNGNDVLYGAEGDDEIRGHKGNDKMYGGRGNDTLLGGAGEDEIYGGNGDDLLRGGKNNDQLISGSGDDRLFGQGGADELSGYWGTGDRSSSSRSSPNTNVMGGGWGDDRIFSWESTSTLRGGPGDDVLFDELGSGAPLVVRGGGGNDSIEIYGGESVIFGGGGSDTVLAYGGDSEVHLKWGTDWASVHGHGSVIYVGRGHHQVAAYSSTVWPMSNSPEITIDAFLRGDSDYVGSNGVDNVVVSGMDGGFAFVNTRDGNDTITADASAKWIDGSFTTEASGEFWGGNGDDTIVASENFAIHETYCGGGRFFNDVAAQTITISAQSPGDTAVCARPFPNGLSFSYADSSIEGANDVVHKELPAWLQRNTGSVRSR